MINEEFVMRSPLRLLEKSIRGGKGSGRLGIFASRKGVGKTACLVQLATDRLFQKKPVIHVSYSSRVDYIINWYEDIFKEITRKKELEKAVEVQNELFKNRVIMNFKQDAARTEQILKSVEAMINLGKFPAQTIIVDGYDFYSADVDDFVKFKKFALNQGLEIWFSASLREDENLLDEKGVPFVLKKYWNAIDILITLKYKNQAVSLTVVKDYDLKPAGELSIRLDPHTLLIDE